MKIEKMVRYLLALVLIALFTGWSGTVSADNNTGTGTISGGNEMPVLTGKLWQQLSRDAKIAFIWGVGHVVTIEKHVEARHPELKRSDVTAKLSEGLTGIPMNDIVNRVDEYFKSHPAEIDTPVMKVVWREMVKPKLSLGIADKPMVGDEDTR